MHGKAHQAQTRRGRLSADAHKIVGTFMDAALPVLAAHFHPDCCIIATRIAKAVLEAYGLDVQALRVEVLVLNPRFTARMRDLEKRRPGSLPDEMVCRVAREPGCWSIGIGMGMGTPQAGKWPGHLVAVVRERAIAGTRARTHEVAREAGCTGAQDSPRDDPQEQPAYLLDLSITQANRPEHHIRLYPLVAAVDAEFLAGRERYGIGMHGSSVVYQADPENRTFLEVDDYRDSQRWLPAAREILAAMTQAIGAPPLPAAPSIHPAGPAASAAGVRTC